MNGGGVARLGELYGLSPATVAGLANITGQPVPEQPIVQPVDEEVEGRLHDPWSVENADKRAVPSAPGKEDPGLRFGSGLGASHGGILASGAAPPANDVAQPLDTTPQGPAPDGFPTVKTPEAGAAGVGAMPVAPGVVTPAHWQPGSHAVSLQHGMKPEELERGESLRDSAAGHGILAADKRLEAAQSAGMADAVYASAHQMASQRANERIAQLNEQRDAYVSTEQKKFEQMAAATQKEVDPDDYWKHKGSGAQLAAALMIGLNEFAVLWRGKGTNTAKAIIDEGIRDNIDAQKTNIANARSALSARESVYGRNLAAFGDQERAILASKVQYLDQVAAMCDAKRAGAKSVEAEAGYQDLMKGLTKDRADYADQFAKLTHTQATEQMNEHFMPPQVLGGAAGAKGKDPLYVPTLGGYARDAETARKLNERGSLRMQIGENMHQIHGLMDEAKKLSSATPGGYLKLQQIDEQIAAKVGDTLTDFTVLKGQGAMSKGDQAVSEEAASLKNVSVQWKPDVFIARKQENIRKAAVSMLEQHRIEGEANGIQKGTEQYAQTPSGPTPVAKLEGRTARPSKNTQAHDDLVQPPKGVPQTRK